MSKKKSCCSKGCPVEDKMPCEPKAPGLVIDGVDVEVVFEDGRLVFKPVVKNPDESNQDN